jgi:hypothetical protein
MTEWSTPFTNGLTDGGPVSAASMWRVFRMLLGPKAEEADRGVIRGWDNELAATSPGADQVAIDTGAAFCHGTPYENTASLTLDATRPSVNTTGKRVVLRKDIVGGGVRATVISSADGTAGLPALTQSESTYWDIPICSFTHATNGAIAALTDEREFLDIGGGDLIALAGAHYTLPNLSIVTATSGTADLYGAYVQAVASLSVESDVVGVTLYPPTTGSTYVQVDIAIGAGGSEVSQAVVPGGSTAAIGDGRYVPLSRPLRIAAGQRIAVAVADSATAQNWGVKLHMNDVSKLEPS